MPPLEYDAPLVCVASPACGILKHMLTSFLTKLGSQIPFHIPTKHHTPSCTTNTTTEDFNSLHRSKVSNFDGIRLYARLFKTLEKPDFPHIPYYHIPEDFTSFAVCESFSGIRSPLWSTIICEYVCGVRRGPLECDDTPRARCHMSMRGRKSPERRILGHNSPNSTERMLVVVI